ncbi:PASTA domain-containing protein [Kribbella catacumbae]|uniref:PASTA domain-containing protein n=1 Tax=Kribbella catacumbae TaxID=460086 RepID=UPI0003A27343|nr:PASTA domain-containing protein [Kribbella catacumbae]
MKIAWCAPLLLLVAGCSGTQQPQLPPTVTVTASVTPPAPPSQQPPSEPTTPPTTARSAVVPAVVGLNHQLAQDTMQAAGFYYLTEVDATGKGRLLVNDRNWVVVSQSPVGGATAAHDSKIVLSSKKIGE